MDAENATPELCPVMLFSGKGGVGKTTLAAATAVHLAASGSRVLLLSTDPAHNLSDVLDVQLGPTPRPVIPGLDAMEVDAKGMFGAVFDGGNLPGGSTLSKLISDAPGIDEFGAIEILLQVLERAQHDVVVVDTAPTGHTLRLLMVPQLLDGWFGTLLELRHKISRAGRVLRRLFKTSELPPGESLEEGLSGGRARINRLRTQLMDGDRTQIVLVTIPETMGVLETTRTWEMLSSHGMPVATIVVNQLQPASASCPHCQRRRAIHEGELQHLHRRIGDLPTRTVESQPWEIRGPEALARVGSLLWAKDDAALPAKRGGDGRPASAPGDARG